MLLFKNMYVAYPMELMSGIIVAGRSSEATYFAGRGFPEDMLVRRRSHWRAAGAAILGAGASAIVRGRRHHVILLAGLRRLVIGLGLGSLLLLRLHLCRSFVQDGCSQAVLLHLYFLVHDGAGRRCEGRTLGLLRLRVAGLAGRGNRSAGLLAGILSLGA
jgi:hypothetical protein